MKLGCLSWKRLDGQLKDRPKKDAKYLKISTLKFG